MVCDVCFEHFLIVIYNVHILVTFFCCSFTKMSAEKIVTQTSTNHVTSWTVSTEERFATIPNTMDL